MPCSSPRLSDRHVHRATSACLLLLLAACARAPRPAALPAEPSAAERFDLVIRGGRVMDPESGLDAVRNVGISDGVVRAIGAHELDGVEVIDAHGLVVAPGFIDLHHHSFNPAALRAKVQDGVTAAVEMELGVADVAAWYAGLEGRAPLHFGAAAGHPATRMAVLTGAETPIPAGEGATRLASAQEIAEIRERIEQQLRHGAIGVGLGIEYTPGATPWEVLEMFRAAARFPGAPVHVHVRGTDEPQFWMETAELFWSAVVTGAPLQIVHANSSFGGDAPRLFEMISAARARGLDVTTETYPYTASMTRIDAAPFDDWEQWTDDRFGRFVWPATGERLTRTTFGEYRKKGGVVVIEGMTEEKRLPTLTSPLPMIVSDGVAEAEGAHPRAAGTFARVLGRYVREQGVLSLMDALRKMTLMPAQRLEARVPAMRTKGRVRIGGDADLTLFDPLTVRDRATYLEPLLPSTGIRHVIVNGVPVLRDGTLLEGAHPGRALRAQVQDADTMVTR